MNGSFREEPPPPTSLEEFGLSDCAEPSPAPTIEHAPAVRSQPAKFRLEMLDDVEVADDPVELVQGLLPMGPALGVCFGPPKSLKSFLLVLVGLHIAARRDFCGRAVQGGAVVYVTSEGIPGVRRRLVAARRQLDLEGRGIPFALIGCMPNLGTGTEDRVTIQNAIRSELAMRGITDPVREIIIDTVRRAMPGKSENKQEDMSLLVDNCEALARAFDCLVMAVHHSPRSDDTRGSGSNALDAAADVMWGVTRSEQGGPATARLCRYKDGQEGASWVFDVRPTEIGRSRDGAPITTCYVEIVTEPERTGKPAGRFSPEKLPDAQRRFYQIIVEAIAGSGVADLAGEAAPRVDRDHAGRTQGAHGHCRLVGQQRQDREPQFQRSIFEPLEHARRQARDRPKRHACLAGDGLAMSTIDVRKQAQGRKLLGCLHHPKIAPRACAVIHRREMFTQASNMPM